jgi:hypothetical protein
VVVTLSLVDDLVSVLLSLADLEVVVGAFSSVFLDTVVDFSLDDLLVVVVVSTLGSLLASVLALVDVFSFSDYLIGSDYY